MTLKLAVVGATGSVGREMLNVLAERQFPAEVTALASRKSQGTEVSFGDRTLKSRDLAAYDFTGTSIVLMSAGSTVSKEWAPKIAATGAVVIDNSSAWRMDAAVPLVVPEVNGHTLARHTKKNIIANPNCSTIHRVVALKALHDEANITRLVVTTFQSVSGAGKDGMNELFSQARAVFVGDPIERHKFPKQIAYNAIPQVGSFLADGSTDEELKQAQETRKILGPDIRMQATCVRVGTFRGHGETCTAEFERPITAQRAKTLLRAAPGVMLIDRHEDGGYITPSECVGDDEVYVSRVRGDVSVANGLSMWIVSDNLKKGAALNAVQIAELLVKERFTQRIT